MIMRSSFGIIFINNMSSVLLKSRLVHSRVSRHSIKTSGIKIEYFLQNCFPKVENPGNRDTRYSRKYLNLWCGL